MAWQEVKYKLISSAPLIMHNGQTADPLNKWSKLKKPITSKRKKTEADEEELGHIQFFGSLYMDEDGPIIPGFVIDAMVVNGAKKFKEGQTAKAGCFCLQHAKLEYDGPRGAEELWNIDGFRFRVPVKIGMQKVPTTRPIFNKWSTVITLSIDDEMVNPSRIFEWLTVAGTQVGLCDWRPQHGRFTVERLNGNK